MKNKVLYFTHPQQIQIEEESIPKPRKDEVLVKNIVSAISAGTEMLFFEGLMPTDVMLDDSIASLQQKITYPFKYGYCAVGKVIETGDQKLKHLVNKWVFVFHPHQSFFCAKQEDLVLLPENLSPYDALFIPSMETAVNLVLDGAPLIGENITILGLGIVGLLTTALLQQFPLSFLAGIDLYPKRRQLCLELGGNAAFDVDHFLQSDFQNMDIVYELTGNPEALNSAIYHVGYEGRIVLGSWYGRKPCSINLGGKFHRNRIKIISSQVSTLASHLHGRWNKSRRFELVLKMLEKIQPAKLVSHQFPISKAIEAYQLLQNKPNDALLVTLTYEG